MLGHRRIQGTGGVGDDDIALDHLRIEHGLKAYPDALYPFELFRFKKGLFGQSAEDDVGIGDFLEE